jgi:hypothetical protein
MSTVLFAVPFLTALFAAGYFVVTHPMVLTITIPRRPAKCIGEPYIVVNSTERASDLLDHAIARYWLTTVKAGALAS